MGFDQQHPSSSCSSSLLLLLILFHCKGGMHTQACKRVLLATKQRRSTPYLFSLSYKNMFCLVVSFHWHSQSCLQMAFTPTSALPLFFLFSFLSLLPRHAGAQQGQLVTACALPGTLYSCSNCTGRSASTFARGIIPCQLLHAIMPMLQVRHDFFFIPSVSMRLVRARRFRFNAGSLRTAELLRQQPRPLQQTIRSLFPRRRRRLLHH